MGNYKFRLSDMMPNSWFYKLKEMSIRGRRNHKKEPLNSSISPTQPHPIPSHDSHPRKSLHFTRELAAGNSPAEPPRKSSKGKPRRKAPATVVNAAARSSPRLAASTSTSGCSCSRSTVDQSVTAGPPLPPPSPPFLTSAKKINGSDDRELKSLDLPPIITRSSSDSADGSTCPPVAITKTRDKSLAKEPRSSPSRRFPVNSPGPKFRIMNNSPRVSSKRFSHVGRRKSGSAKRSLSDSTAIVKSTNDPQRDFMESMVEMIVENKISASNELEDLLACYLSLNTDEYHDVIIKVFKQIWFDMTNIGLH